ncbi:MAG: autotransporter outer membrane beta-barrel domain-containing protein, partial [Campylobacter sp.]|uniref:autotransporter domain-containing protein n=1 Tax=Campylobacter sp. TaxID=205 RepID=UPI001B0711B4
KGGQIAGNVYVNNGSTLSGNGVIKQNLTNDGSTVRPGNADLTDLTVDGTYTQKGTNSKLILDFGNDKNSKLIANNFNIQDGKLEYNPLEKYFTINKEVKIDLGKLADHISEFDEVLVASNNSIKFDVRLDNDKSTINKDPNSNPTPPAPTIGEASTGSGTTSGGGDSNGGTGGASSGDNGNLSDGTNSGNPTGGDNNQGGSATSGNGADNGSSGSNPTQPNAGSSEANSGSSGGAQSGQNGAGSSSGSSSSNLNPSNTGSSGSQNPSTPNNPSQNTQKPNSGVIIVTPVVRSDAYASNSAQLSQTMRDIRSRNDLNPQYQQFFATLDSSTQENYKSTMSRIEGRSIGDMTSIQSSTHNNFMQNNMLFSLNPATSTLFAYNQNPYDSGVLVASVASDYIIDLGLNSATPKDYWYINPTFKRYNGDGFDGYQSGASVNLAQHIGSNGLIAYGIGASLSKLDFDIGATAKSSNFDIALNYTHDFESFKLLSGGSFMVSFNENERTVANTLSSDYKSYSSSLQLGVAKDFRHYSIVVTPLGYLGYGKIYQESFKESGGIFAKNYDSINHDIYTVGMGLNLAYEGSDEKSRYTGYIIYERMLDGYNMDASAQFNDFKGQKFSQRYHLDKNRLNLGVGAEYAFNSGYFAKFGIGSEFATTSDNYNLSVTFGKRF